MEGVVVPVGLGDAEIEVAGADGVDVGHRAAGRFHRAADAVARAVLVNQAANRPTHRVVNAGEAAGADGHEALRRLRAGHGGGRQGHGGERGDGQAG